MAPEQLILSHYSIRNAGFAERVRAAAAAGYDAIGLALKEYERLRTAGHSDSELRDVLGEHDQYIVEFEALRGWASSGAAREKYLHDLDTVDRMADAFGPPHHVQVIGPYEGGIDEAAAGFAALCERLAVRGIRAAIEYLPQMTNIPDAAAAWQIVQGAGQANGGLCVDSWHHFRSGEGAERLAQVPGERVYAVQINDGPRTPTVADYYIDCTSYRLPPGDGDFDLVGFVRTLRGMGVTAPFSVEVISTELDRVPAAEVARLIADRTRTVLAQAG